MNYELYHDESKVSGYWHGILLVPVEQKIKIGGLLNRARFITGYPHPISLGGVEKRNRVFNCVRSWISIAFAALRSKNLTCPIYLGNNTFIEKSPDCFQSKFLLFRETNNFEELLNFPDFGSKVETTFRFGLKGGAHALFDEDNPVNIVKLHFDGHEHYLRHLSRERIIDRLNGLRGYFSIAGDIDDRSSDHRKPDAQEYLDCQLLQLTDLLVGSFRSAFGYYTKPLHYELSLPARDYIARAKCGYKRMQNSRWFNSIWFSQCFLKNGVWQFQPLSIEFKEPFTQLDLFEG